MPTIVSATYTVDSHAQADGRSYVNEKFIDDEGNVHENLYLAPSNTDYDAVLAEHRAQIQDQLNIPTERGVD